MSKLNHYFALATSFIDNDLFSHLSIYKTAKNMEERGFTNNREIKLETNGMIKLTPGQHLPLSKFILKIKVQFSIH